MVVDSFDEWHLDPKLSKCSTLTLSTLLDSDLRDVSTSVMSAPNEWTSHAKLKLSKPVIVQVQKVRDVFTPKSILGGGSNSKRVLRMTLSDGQVMINAVELRGRWRQISPMDTPPGTKLRLKSKADIEVVSGFLVLEENHFDLLGGHVESMVAKWEAAKDMALFKRAVNVNYKENYVPWVPFGKKMSDYSKANRIYREEKSKSDKNGNDKNDDNEGDPFFESARAEAINEAKQRSGCTTKVFGKAGDIKSGNKSDNGNNHTRGARSKGPKRERLKESAEDSYKAPSRPSNVSLLDFLGDHLPDVPATDEDVRDQQQFEEQKTRHGQRRDEVSNAGFRRGRGGQRVRDSGRHQQRGRGFQDNFGSLHQEQHRGRGQGQYVRNHQRADRQQLGDHRSQTKQTANSLSFQQREYHGKRRQPNYQPHQQQRQEDKQYLQPQQRDPCEKINRQQQQQRNFESQRNQVTQEEHERLGASSDIASGRNGFRPRNFNGARTALEEGEVCMVKYWEDGEYYPAEIKTIGQKGTAVVLFLDYGNCEEVYVSDIKAFN